MWKSRKFRHLVFMGLNFYNLLFLFMKTLFFLPFRFPFPSFIYLSPILSIYYLRQNDNTGGSIVVKALCYKAGGRGFDSRRGDLFF
jgi:hypothetical protein